MLTCPAWGTLLTQITGVMEVEYAAGTQTVYVSPVSGVILMLCMGFGIPALFGARESANTTNRQCKPCRF